MKHSTCSILLKPKEVVYNIKGNPKSKRDWIEVEVHSQLPMVANGNKKPMNPSFLVERKGEYHYEWNL